MKKEKQANMKKLHQRAFWAESDVDLFLNTIPNGMKGPLINQAIRKLAQTSKDGVIDIGEGIVLKTETSMFDN